MCVIHVGFFVPPQPSSKIPAYTNQELSHESLSYKAWHCDSPSSCAEIIKKEEEGENASKLLDERHGKG